MTGIEFAAATTALAGLLGAIYAALRYQREDAGAVVSQQAQVLAGMRDLNDELEAALDRCREQRERYASDARQTEDSLDEARKRVRQLEAMLNGD